MIKLAIQSVSEDAQHPTLKTPASVRTRPLPAPTRNTAATFSKNAIPALEMRIRGPTEASWRKGSKPSVTGIRSKLIAAQT